VLALGAWAAGIASEFNPASVEPVLSGEATSGRIILGFRNSATPSTARSKVAADTLAVQKVTALSTRTGVPFKGARRLGETLQVLEVAVPATGQGMQQTLELLRADPDVEFAEPDQRRFPHAIPNDTLFPGQWYLQKAATTPSAVDAIGAWDLATGSKGVVVADLDTGVRYDHPDLQPATAGGRLLPGFDFISDRDNANDGDGWDADPSDPGDWLTASEAALGPLSGCPVGDSSWHGTRVAGIIGALTNNAQGVSGLTWNAWVLPARALGKCGGFDSDIIAAMLWSGGVAVDGAPANPYPAKIINMSLGGKGTCSQGYSNAVSQLTARGVLVVASVGNEGGQVVAPANCPGVVGVGGIRHAGTKVGFSNLGPGTAISAPGGNCVNTGAGEPCLYSIDTTTNLGTQSPAANGYTDQIRFNVGTSFSAPIVSGIAGLMVAVNGRLTPAQLTARLQEGATRPFPAATDPSIPTCRVPVGPNDLQTSECVCTTLTCGAGMANALGAVSAALRPVAAVLLPPTVSAGQNVVLRGSGSGAACNRQVTGFAWTIVDAGPTPPGIVGGQTDTAIVVAPATGSFTVRLTVTDDLGRQDSANVLVTPNSATTAAPATASGPACPVDIVVVQPVSVSVAPDSVTLVAGTGTQAFTATVANSADTRVSWSVNGIAGGNASVGTISATGLYVAPATRPTPATVTVSAIAAADPSRSGSSTVTISPAPFNPGSGGGGGGGGGGRVDLLVLLALGLSGLGRLARPVR
jgi:serine protease